MKKKSLGKRKNTYGKKKSLYRVFVESPEFWVDPTSQLVYSEPITGPDLNETDSAKAPGHPKKWKKKYLMFYYFIWKT